MCACNRHGLAGHRVTGNTDQFKTPLVVAYYDVDYTKNPKGTNYWRNRLMYYCVLTLCLKQIFQFREISAGFFKETFLASGLTCDVGLTG